MEEDKNNLILTCKKSIEGASKIEPIRQYYSNMFDPKVGIFLPEFVFQKRFKFSAPIRDQWIIFLPTYSVTSKIFKRIK
jgi:hypothetical protein